MSLVQATDGTSDFIQYVDTANLQKGRQVLQSMMDHFATDHPLSMFLNSKASHLLEVPSGDTPISLEALAPKTFVENSVQLPETFETEVFTENAGVYAVQNAEGDTYIGSSINAEVRWANHYSCIGTKTSKFYQALSADIEGFRFTELHNTTDFRSEFAAEYPDVFKGPDAPLIKAMLRTFTQYEARLLEQAVISAIEPSLNTNLEVYIQSGWNPESVGNFGGRSVEVTCLDTQEVFTCESIREAARVTDVHFRTVTNIMNFPGYSSYSAALECKVSFVDHSEPLNTGSPHERDPELLLPQVSYSTIPPNEVWVYDSDFNMLGSYGSSNQAAMNYGISKKTVLHCINRNFVKVTIAGLALQVMFTRNPGLEHGTAATPIVVVDTFTGLAYLYSSLKKTCLALLYGGKTTALLKTYVNSSVFFGDRYALLTETEYLGAPTLVGPQPLLSKKMRRAAGKPAKPVILVDTTTDPQVVTRCASAGDALLFLGHSSSAATSFLKRYIKTGNLYKKKYKIMYAEDYPGAIDKSYNTD